MYREAKGRKKSGARIPGVFPLSSGSWFLNPVWLPPAAATMAAATAVAPATLAAMTTAASPTTGTSTPASGRCCRSAAAASVRTRSRGPLNYNRPVHIQRGTANVTAIGSRSPTVRVSAPGWRRRLSTRRGSVPPPTPVQGCRLAFPRESLPIAPVAPLLRSAGLGLVSPNIRTRLSSHRAVGCAVGVAARRLRRWRCRTAATSRCRRGIRRA